MSSSDGIKAMDVVWLAPERRQEVDTAICFAHAPEICVEILSPSNTAEEISEKIACASKQRAHEGALAGVYVERKSALLCAWTKLFPATRWQ